MIIVGASGHAKVIIEIAKANHKTINAIFDQDTSKTTILGHAVTHTDIGHDQGCGIIAIGNNSIREKVAQATKINFCPPLIHPTAVVSPSAQIGEGTVVMAGAIINAEAVIGKHVIVNTAAVVEHDCILEDFVHISPKAALAGNVTVGRGSHVGIGAQVIQGITIGENAVIGAGAAIIENVAARAVVVGVPGKQIK